MRPVHVRASDAPGETALGAGAGSVPPPSDKTDKTDNTGLGFAVVGSECSAPAPFPCFAACNHRVISAPKNCRVHSEKSLRPSALRVRGRVKRADAIAIGQQRQGRVKFGLATQPRAVEP